MTTNNQPVPPTPAPAAAAAQPDASQIPGWSNLEAGFGDTPVFDFRGKANSWNIDTANRFGARVEITFTGVEVIQATEPVNKNADVTISIKISKSENSAWGKFGKSCAEKIGVGLEAFDINGIMGQEFHLYRLRESYGKNEQGEDMVGDVWRAWEHLAPGAAHTAIPEAVFANQPDKPQRATVTTPSQPAQPATPAAQPTGDPTETAKNLLDGKDDAGFFGVVLTDPTVKTDPALINSIVSGGFVQGVIADGSFTKGDDGIYHRA